MNWQKSTKFNLH